MPLTIGETLGSYRILAAVGAGGMGEVYRARDGKLGREVAIKVLPEEFTQQPERLARFEREARLLAALSHPGIATLHGLEESDGKPFLVMELVEGETLAERLARGPLAPDEALAIARQIAEALEAAHERGVVHRDLKPANVKVDADGRVKVLDFGLAKALSGDEAAEGELSQSPTLSHGPTQAGVILGTAAYMSPEQARGRAVDHRSDVFSFGVVLYEMLTGRKAFPGDDVSEILAGVIKSEPDWSALPARTDPRVRELVRRCLRKDRRTRRQSIGDVRVEIEEILAQPDRPGPPAARPSGRDRTAWLAIAALGLSTIALAWTHFRETSPERQRVRFSFPVPDEASSFSSVQLAVSPDGATVAFVLLTADGGRLLGTRALDSLESRVFPGTDDASFPFWSPDGEFIGFFTGDALKKVRVAGGPVETVCDVPSSRNGGAWNEEGVILFGSDQGIARVAAAGGTPSAVTALDDGRQETAHQHPDFLPDGRRFLFLARSAEPEAQGIYLGSLDAAGSTRLMGSNLHAQYAPGYLLTVNEGVLWAHPLDAETLAIAGSPTPLIEDVVFNASNGRGGFSVSGNGVLVFHTSDAGRSRDRQLVLISREDRATASMVEGPLESPRHLRLSPDGERLAVVAGRGDDVGLWVYPLDGRPAVPLTFGERGLIYPVWSPDGSRVAFRQDSSLVWLPADGGTLAPEPLSPTADAIPGAWTPDGQELIVATQPSATSPFGDMLAIPIDGSAEPRVVVGAEYGPSQPRLSPDGKWLAYRSDVTGRREIWVRSYRGRGAPTRASTDGGTEPVWSRDGRELFYVESQGPDSRLMGVAVETSPALRVGPPRVVIGGGFATNPRPRSDGVYDVAPDGRFVMIQPVASPGAPPVDQLTVVIGWSE